jgi:hypothetical protein
VPADEFADAAGRGRGPRYRSPSGPPRVIADIASPFRLTLFADIAIEHHKDWTIDDLIAAGEMSCWYGYPGAGKSVLVGDAAAHVAGGMPWFGRPVRQGAVLYLAAERAGLVKRRLAAWRKHHGIDEIALGVLDGGAFDLHSDTFHASHVVDHGLELARHYECSVAWVIVDTKSQVMGSGNPNEDVDILQMVANLKYIQYGLGMPHLTVVDHVPYSSPERIRGSGALGGSIDASFLIKRAGIQRLMSIGSKEPNDGPEELDLRFSLKSIDLGRAKNGKVTTAPVVVPATGGPSGEKPVAIRLSNEGQRVCAAYGRLLDAGKSHAPPNVPGVWRAAKAVTLADLRDQAIALGVHPHPEPIDPIERKKWLGATRQAWSRGMRAAQAAGMLRLENGFVWDPRSPAKRDALIVESDKP